MNTAVGLMFGWPVWHHADNADDSSAMAKYTLALFMSLFSDFLKPTCKIKKKKTYSAKCPPEIIHYSQTDHSFTTAITRNLFRQSLGETRVAK
jgi:hypothetical protein